MQILSATMKNFRGIKSATFDIAGGSPGRVVTLVGLNESGKTTLLEAFSNFVSLDPDAKGLVNESNPDQSPKSFIPKNLRGRFSDSIVISASVIVEKDDLIAVADAFKAKNLKLIIPDTLPVITVSKDYSFKDSELLKEMRYWSLWDFSYTKGTSNKVHVHKRGSSINHIWHLVVSTLAARLPAVVYFPTFLFDVPDRIYLSKAVGESSKNAYYRKTLGNALRSAHKSYSLDKHILDRISSMIVNHGVQSLMAGSDTADIDAVFADLSQELTRVIIGAWKDIFGAGHGSQRIDIKWGVDPEKNNAVFVEMSIVLGDRLYLLNERSLGFRWFFSFLLFTQFRRLDESGNGTIFLFDEPASNLHSAAQTSLLQSFGKIIGDKDYVVYSTHSHYMIEPLWLEKAYIVRNRAFDVDNESTAFYIPKSTDIVAIPYKRFVSANPSGTTYFQPVLDALKHRFSPLELRGPAVILEGKFDYYPFRYLLSKLEEYSDLRCYSANGAGEMGTLISILRAGAVPFVILLDDDKQGRLEKSRYIKDYRVSDFQVTTLADADSSLAGMSFEGIFQNDVKDLIEQHDLKEGSLKAQAASLFQILLATSPSEPDLTDTIEKFKSVLATVRDRLSHQK